MAAVLMFSGTALQARGDAPWQKTAGPPGLSVTVIYKTNGIVYAGTDTQGVHKSTDNGSTWHVASNGIERTSVQDFIASGGNLLVAVLNKCQSLVNVFKSTDGGASWVPTSGLSGKVIHSFAIKGNVVYAAATVTTGSAIFRSNDNGNTWQNVASPIVKGDKVFVSDNAIIVASDNQIWRSITDGASWDLVESSALTGISSFARAGTKLFAAGTTVIWTSTNNGASWSLAPFSSGAYSFSSDGTTIYLGSTNKVFRSTDLGMNWVDVSAGLGRGAVTALLYDGSNLLAATPIDSAGIYRSVNGGTSWASATTGLPVGSSIRSLTSFTNFVFAGTDGDGIYRSVDHGDTWSKTDSANSLLTQTKVLTFCRKDNTLFAGAANGIYKSVDNGSTFQRTLNGFPANTNVAVFSLTVSNGNIIAGVAVTLSSTSALNAIFYSSDSGSTWHQANLPVDATFVPAVASDGSSLVYAGVEAQSSSNTGLYKSSDAGVTWLPKTSVLNVDINTLATKQSNVLASTLFTAFYSNDFGELEWTSSTPSSVGIDTYTLKRDSIFAGNSDGMFLSTDNGASWNSLNDGFPSCPTPTVQASCTDDTYLFAGTFGEGVWRKALGPPALIGVVSRKSHGKAGVFDIALPVGAVGVEDRIGDAGVAGNHTIVFSYTQSPAGTTASVGAHNPMSGSGSVDNISYVGNDMIVHLTNVSDAQVLTLNTSGGPSSPVGVSIGFLAGDSSADHTVNASDVAQAKSQIGQPATAANFRTDVNANGAVTASDIAVIKLHSGENINIAKK